MKKMKIREQKQRKKIEDLQLAVSSRFGRYKKEEKKGIREFDLKKNEALEMLEKTWKEWKATFTDVWTEYRNANHLLRLSHISVSPEDIRLFSIYVSRFAEDDFFEVKAGIFLSALINSGPESDYSVVTLHDAGLYAIGFRNVKEITIECNSPPALVGWEMGKGRIIVNGSTGENAGLDMKGGEIIISGNTGNGLGRCMHGGIVRVEGDAGEETGVLMIGGELHIKGDISSIGNDIVGGRIYHKGKLIVDK